MALVISVTTSSDRLRCGGGVRRGGTRHGTVAGVVRGLARTGDGCGDVRSVTPAKPDCGPVLLAAYLHP